MSADTLTWSDEEAARLRAQAQYLFSYHGHGGYRDRLTRENCGACCLGGYTPRGGWGDEYPRTMGPNHAGWERAYVQAGRPIKRRWSEAFRAAANAPGAYGEALRTDLDTFGWPAVVS